MLTTILVGLSGSGKSTHAKTLNQMICSTDKYVEEQANTLGINYETSFILVKINIKIGFKIDTIFCIQCLKGVNLRV